MSIDGQDSMLLELYGDLEWAYQRDLELFDEPTYELAETVRDWAVRLHEVGVLSDDAYDYAMDITTVGDEEEN